MFRFYLAAVDVVPAAVVLLPLFLVFYCTIWKNEGRTCVWCCLFCLYLSAVFALVGVPNVKYVRLDVNLNLIPVLGLIADWKNSFLNIVLFVPLGFFLPVLWNRYRRFFPAFFFGLGLSLLIELLQMLTYRATDINDLITNALGTAVGFWLAKPVAEKVPAAAEGKAGAYALCALSFGVMFFLHPILSPMIWDRIL